MKNVFFSKTVFGIGIAAVGMVAGLFGGHVDPAAAQDLIEYGQSIAPTVIQTGGLLVAFYGRWKARKPLTFGTSK